MITAVPGWPMAPGTRSVGEPIVASGGTLASLIHHARYSMLPQNRPSRPQEPLPPEPLPQLLSAQPPPTRPLGTDVTAPVLPSVITGEVGLAISTGRAAPSRAMGWYGDGP